MRGPNQRFRATVFQTNEFPQFYGRFEPIEYRLGFNTPTVIGVFKNKTFSKSSSENTRDIVTSSEPFSERKFDKYNASNSWKIPRPHRKIQSDEDP